MVKLAFKDLFQSFNNRCIKSVCVALIYFGILGTFINGASVRETIALTVMILPFCIVVVPSTPQYVDKAMYMCPMSKNERKHFILYSYLYRVLLYMLLSVTCLAVGTLITDINIWIMIMYLVNNITVVLSLYQKIDGGYIITKNASKTNRTYDIWSAVAIFFGYVNYGIGISMFENVGEKTYIIAIIYGVIWAITQLPIAIRSVCKIKGIIEAAVEYREI